MTTAADHVTTTEPTPGWVVAVLGVLLLPLAAGAFILSFEQLWPVMLLGGWSTTTAWLGPVVLDITSAAGAVMHVVSRDRSVRAWGLTLLLGGTALSILGNVAGHNIHTNGDVRTQLPSEMSGWTLPEEWQPVVLMLSIAVPVSVAVLVHAFGAVFKAWLATRPAADSATAADPTWAAVGTRPAPTGAVESAPDSHRPDPARIQPQPTIGPDRPAESDADPTRPALTRPAADSDRDLRKSDESDTRLEPTAQDPTRPDRQPTADPTAAVTRPDSDPTRPTDPTRPDSESDLADLVARARQLVESGEIRPTADAIRPALGVGQAKAREIRDALKNNDRHGLRAVS